VKISDGSPHRWLRCEGEASPVATTTDGRSNPMVWIVGAEGDGRLHGYRGDTGEPLFLGGGPNDVMIGLRHFQTVLPAGGRLFVAADRGSTPFHYRSRNESVEEVRTALSLGPSSRRTRNLSEALGTIVLR
jgi:hypothetical protein